MTDEKAAVARVVIANQKGLHARAAAKFVKTPEQFQSVIWVEKQDVKVPATSIMGLMMLAASIGTELMLSAVGEDAEEALKALRELVDGKFGEE